MKYLFVDFDGVLHGEEFNTNYFSHSPMFRDRLLPYKNHFRIVVSSSWRETYEHEILVEAFEKELHDIVVGQTPILVEGMANGGRYLEILQYCQEHNIKYDQWMAIDDMSRLFPEHCTKLILTKSNTGITPKVLDFVEDFVKTPYPTQRKNI